MPLFPAFIDLKDKKNFGGEVAERLPPERSRSLLPFGAKIEVVRLSFLHTFC
jgi:siroheme synthase (precorrin-2 oxidase/ferrochelatase)